MKRRAGVKEFNQRTVTAVILIVVLAMLLYLGIQISRGFYSKVSTQRTQTVTESQYAYLEGCIFRDDSTVSASGDVVYYTVRDGEKVGVGQIYAEVFSNTGLSDSESAEIQKRLNALSQAIGLLEDGLEADGSASHLGQVNESILSGYYSYVDSILAGDLKSADKAGDKLLSGLVDHSALTSGDAARDRLSMLKEERELLLSSLGGTKKSLVSDKSFNFFYGTDGYESSLNVSCLGGMTPTKLDSLMSSAPKKADGAIGKMTESSKWYLAIPLTNEYTEEFEPFVNSAFTVDFIGFEGLEISMLLEEVYVGEDGAYMLMSSQSLAHVPPSDRIQSVRILLDRYTGYRVPKEALHRIDRQDGVYILIGNVIEFRRVTVIGSGNDHFTVKTYESDAQDSVDSSIPYLNINDLIVTSGNDLYDGKQLD
ncbi:MAG: hypothetical protein IJY39_04035 [Clostridia bacterium]|nr:hypothetical protein [Clostridia bacterium]